jgi:Putative zinc-finger
MPFPGGRRADLMMRDACAQLRLELGVYLLGAIEPGQRAVVDHHVVTCPACRAELSDLAGLPSLLRRVPADVIVRLLAQQAVPAVPVPLPALARRMTAVRRRARMIAVAAALATGVAAAAGVQGLHAAENRPARAAVVAGAVTVQATNPVTGARAAVRYAARPWGTELEVNLTGVAPGTRCQLLVAGPAGQLVVAGGWYVTTSGPATWYPAAVPLTASRVHSFNIVSGGKTLVTVPA